MSNTASSTTKHTPTPWKVEGETRIYAVADGVHLACTWARHVSDVREDGESWIEMRDRTQPLRDAAKAEEQGNAAFIVRACNSHEQLVAALTMIRDADDDCESDGLPRIPAAARAKIDAALAAAEA